MAKERGSIAFFATYRPPVPLDIFSCPNPPASKHDELHMTDGVSYNHNGNTIPPAALKKMLKRPKLASEATVADVDEGRVSGVIFVSERDGLEVLHIALCFTGETPKVKVFNFASVFGTYKGVRMEDSGCIAGNYIVYVTTKDPAQERRQPWTAVYKTHLETGKTERLTPAGQADLSPAPSPSGKRIAVASYQEKEGWKGEIEDLKTDIFMMNTEKPLQRKLIVRNGGWPSWGSDTVIFFHRKVGDFWGVFRADITKGPSADAVRVTPDGFHAITPAAIDSTTVVVATIRQKSEFNDVRVQAQYRHIEVFNSSSKKQPIQITQRIKNKADHYNPFVIDGGKRIGYHRCRSDLLENGQNIQRQFNKVHSPHPDVETFRVSGVFPTFSKDGSKLAFVDNEFKAVWVADKKGLRVAYEARGADSMFSPVWNQNSEKDILYVCMGPSFNAAKRLDICAIPNVSRGAQHRIRLTKHSNNAFPSSNPDGTRVVFRSTRDWGNAKHKNLYIMEDAQTGDYGEGKITRLTNGEWTDTHCQWSPNGDWIVFSSTRDKPKTAPPLDNGLDPGYFAVYVVKPDNPDVVIRVVKSGEDLAGHVNHPFFSPDCKSIVITADLAGVSADPISLPLFLHSVRPYGDIFSVDIDPDNIKEVKEFTRITHSRYEYAIAAWTVFSTRDPHAVWNLLVKQASAINYTPACPYMHRDGGESWQMTGHLCIPKRCC